MRRYSSNIGEEAESDAVVLDMIHKQDVVDVDVQGCPWLGVLPSRRHHSEPGGTSACRPFLHFFRLTLYEPTKQ